MGVKEVRYLSPMGVPVSTTDLMTFKEIEDTVSVDFDGASVYGTPIRLGVEPRDDECHRKSIDRMKKLSSTDFAKSDSIKDMCYSPPNGGYVHYNLNDITLEMFLNKINMNVTKKRGEKSNGVSTEW